MHGTEQRMTLGATAFGQFVQMLSSGTEDSDVRDLWVTRMRALPTTVVSTTLQNPLDWPQASVVGGDGVEAVAAVRTPGPGDIAAKPESASCTVHAVLTRCHPQRLTHIDRVSGEPVRRYEHSPGR